MGRIYSHTVVCRSPDDTWEVPYVLAIVKLDEGWSMLSRLLVDDPLSLDPREVAGTEVHVRFMDEGRPPFRRMPAFEPVTEKP